jgi:hypothetical protein
MLKGIDLSLSFSVGVQPTPLGTFLLVWRFSPYHRFGKSFRRIFYPGESHHDTCFKIFANSLVFTDLSLKSLPLIMFKYLLCQ